MKHTNHQKASAIIRPNARKSCETRRRGLNYTANYMTWVYVRKYAEAVQKNNLTFGPALADVGANCAQPSRAGDRGEKRHEPGTIPAAT